MANKAFKGETWVNDGRGRAAAAQWRFGHSSLAVDGNMDTQLANCAILDNYRGASEAPLWRVDLGKTQRVRGVLILTWQGKGQGRSCKIKKFSSRLGCHRRRSLLYEDINLEVGETPTPNFSIRIMHLQRVAKKGGGGIA